MLPSGQSKARKKKKSKTGASKEPLEGVSKPSVADTKKSVQEIVAAAKARVAEAESTRKRSVPSSKVAPGKGKKSRRVEVEGPKEVKQKGIAGSKDDLFGQGAQARSRRRTDDGLALYTEDELNIGQGGGTKNCPFDCDCCF